MKEILDKCRAIAPGNAPVFIIGEYGSGKCWIAQNIHDWSSRKNCNFSRINCYSMQADEIEKRLYGYLSFNGDRSVHINRGLFEICDGGTLYFDGFEILPRKLQLKIINTVVSKTTNHVGSSLRTNTNVRLIVSAYGTACHNRGNSLRNETLIYEINPHIIFMPALRNRREDIASLVRTFLDTFANRDNGLASNSPEISPEALYVCIRYHWPGNVRQLKNAVRLAALLSDGQILKPEHLPESVRNYTLPDDIFSETMANKSYQTAERNLLHELLHYHKFTPEKIAATLDISPQLLGARIRKYRLDTNGLQLTKKERTKT